MPKRQKKKSSPPKVRKQNFQGGSPQARESKLVGMAIDLAESQLKNRTASSQVLTHFLKLGTVQAQIELEKLKRENELVTAKTDNLKSQKKVEELYAKALEAMTSYRGRDKFPEDEDD